VEFKVGLNIVLYDLRGPKRLRDDRFDWFRRAEDHALSLWLNDGNAIYRYFGDPHQLNDYLRTFDFAAARKRIEGHIDSEEERRKEFDLMDTLESPERFAHFASGTPTVRNVRDLWRGEIYERPKDIAAARAWVETVDIPYAPVGWHRKRFLDLLDLLEADENLWLYESG
jgi:hypothetical protein